MSYSHNSQTFTEVFQRYRLRSEIERLADLCDFMREEGMAYDVSLYTRWKNGDRLPDRRATLALINIFAKRGGIFSVDQANELLRSAGHEELSEGEIKTIHKKVLNKHPYRSQSANQIAKTELKNDIEWSEWIYHLITTRGDIALITYNFLLFTAYWIVVWIKQSKELDHFLTLYFIVAIIGGIFTLQIGRKLSKQDKYLGRSMYMFSAGLIAQAFGQIVYFAYIVLTAWSIPYPSTGDLGFFGSMFFYLLGIYYLGRSFEIKISIHALFKKKIILFFPLTILIISYWFLLQNYTFSSYKVLKIILDFGYPLIEYLYISLALYILAMTKNILGRMKLKIQLLTIALILQYVADYMFVYQTEYNMWSVMGFNDYVYLLSYTTTSIGLTLFKEET